MKKTKIKNLYNRSTGFLRSLWTGNFGLKINNGMLNSLPKEDLSSTIDSLDRSINVFQTLFLVITIIEVFAIFLPLKRPIYLSLLVMAIVHLIVVYCMYTVDIIMKLKSRLTVEEMRNGEDNELSTTSIRANYIRLSLRTYFIKLAYFVAVEIGIPVFFILSPILDSIANKGAYSSMFIGPVFLLKVAMAVAIGVGVFSRVNNEFISQALYPDAFDRALGRNKYTDGRIATLLDDKERKSNADLVLGYDVENHAAPVINRLEARKTSMLIVGPPGTGKTRTIIKPSVKQSIDFIIEYIRKYPEISQWENFKSRDVAAMFQSGLVVFDPTNDLTETVYNLAKDKGIPEEMLHYVDPENPDTVSINVMSGNDDQIRAKVSSLSDSLKKTGNDNSYFSGAETSSLSNMVNVALGVCTLENKQPSLEYLVDLYNSEPERDRAFELFNQYVEQVKKYQKYLNDKVNKLEILSDDELVAAKNIANYLHTQEATIRYMNDNFPLLYEKDNDGNVIPATHKERGYEYVRVHSSEFLQKSLSGLKDRLSILSSNQKLQRVLLNIDNAMNVDKVFRNGGIILINLDHRGLGEFYSNNVFGKITLNYFIECIMRREPNNLPYIDFVLDELVPYMTDEMLNTPAQTRKYNVGITAAVQALSQITTRFNNKSATESFITAMRTRVSFGDASGENARALSELFGEHDRFTEETTNSGEGLVKHFMSSRQAQRIKPESVPNITPAEVMALEANTILVRHPTPDDVDVFSKVKQKDLDGEDTNIQLDLSNSNTNDYKCFKYYYDHTFGSDRESLYYGCEDETRFAINKYFDENNLFELNADEAIKQYSIKRSIESISKIKAKQANVDEALYDDEDQSNEEIAAALSVEDQEDTSNKDPDVSYADTDSDEDVTPTLTDQELVDMLNSQDNRLSGNPDYDVTDENWNKIGTYEDDELI